MKRLILAVLSTAFAASIGMSTAVAQDGPPQFRPLEMWACKFKDRKDQGDIDDVYKMIESGTGDAKYAAFQLNPYFVGNRREQFDFLYIGVWDTGSEMGSDLENYMANGGDAGEAWDETVDCSSSVYASSRIQAPQATEDGNFVLTVSDCNVDHGNSNAQAAGVIRRFNDYRVAHGMTVGTILWYPVAGGGDAEFDFKLVNTFTGAKAWGDYFSWYVDNQAYNVWGPMSQSVVSCDESRVYIGRTIMNNMM